MDWRAQFEEIMISIIVIGMSSHNVRDRMVSKIISFSLLTLPKSRLRCRQAKPSSHCKLKGSLVFPCLLVLNFHLLPIGEKTKLVLLNWSPWTQLKRQRFAEIGYINLSFIAHYQGEWSTQIYTDFIRLSTHFCDTQNSKVNVTWLVCVTYISYKWLSFRLKGPTSWYILDQNCMKWVSIRSDW